jgi:SAM-dependent methyltransferase
LRLRQTGAVVVDDVLRAATDRGGRTPLYWAAAPVRDAERVLDLYSRDGELADVLPAGRWLGVDPVWGRRATLCASPLALPLRRNAVDAACLLLALPSVDDVDRMFAELRRVLRPGGTLVVLVPSAVPRTLTELRAASVLAAVHRRGWTNRSALDQAGWLLAAADFAVLADDRAAFTLPLPDDAAAEALAWALPRAGVWPEPAPPNLHARLSRLAGPGRLLPVPMRRLIARR